MPAPGSSFVGRGPERVRLVRVVVEERLVTLVGPPGVGKTRLAAGFLPGQCPTCPKAPRNARPP